VSKRASAECVKMPIKKKKYSARFPPARIKKIMQTDEDVGKVAAPVPVIISRALELFVENLLKKANHVTLERGARTLTPSHLKMCIKSEKRFDFLKELVSTVPDLQGDHDEPLALYQNMTGETQETNTTTSTTKRDTSNTSQQRPKLPRQLSTPRPRGRPRALSADQDQPKPKILQEQKKRKKKRQTKFMDDDELSDLSNHEEDTIYKNNTNAAATTTSNSTNSASNNDASNAIVTCTVTTTGLTSPNNGAVNNGGSKLGFTISIPSSSLSSFSSSSSPLTYPATALPSSAPPTLKHNGFNSFNSSKSATLSSSSSSSSFTSSTLTSATIKTANNFSAAASVGTDFPDATAISPHQDIKLALINNAHDQAVQDVDENYDDC